MEPNTPETPETPPAGEIARYYGDPDTEAIRQQLNASLGYDAYDQPADAENSEPPVGGDTMDMSWGSPEID